ncbi:MAG: hypothetical protein FJ138_17310 [Deltaproteobacteria bacterium]|nr:hypothetical protein [Deltaproteobacteria bacterium]
MLHNITGVLSGWVARYGTEASFVGKVAMGALLPAGVSKLLEVGLEAACDYLQDKSSSAHERGLAERLDRLGVPSGALGQALTQVDLGGQRALARAFEARLAGTPADEARAALRALVEQDPALSALRDSLGDIAERLTRLSAQGEVLIAGQRHQTEALEELLRMLRSVAAQVGAPALTPEPPAAALAALAALPPPPAPLGALESLDSLDSLGALGAPDSLGALGAPGVLGAHARAETLVERFYAQQRARGGEGRGVEPREAVALVERLLRAQEAPQGAPAPHVGAGRVALTLIEAGPRPIAVVKWLCEAWGYPLQEALVAAQGGGVVRRGEDFVGLAQAQRALEGVGARARLTTA